MITPAKKILISRKGSTFIEAAIVYPIVFMSVMVIIRLILILFYDSLGSASDHMAGLSDTTKIINEVTYIRWRVLAEKVL